MLVCCARENAGVWRVTLAPNPAAEAILIDAEGVADLEAVVAEAAAAADCRVLVLVGQAGSFCQGLDLDSLFGSASVGNVAVAAHAFASCLGRLRDLNTIVIAAVDGEVIGGGVGLAACADCVIATPRATFGIPELALGLLPAIVMPLLLERMTRQGMRRLALGGTVDANAARDMGLVDRLVADETELTRALRAEIRQALRLAPQAVDDFKALCRQDAELPLTKALELGAQRSAERLVAPEVTAGIRAFLDGDIPPWFARYRGAEGMR